jgi:hypothetical protein
MTLELRLMSFHLCSSVYCYWLIGDCDFFPPLLGGYGDTTNAFKNLPFYEPVPGLQTYCLVHIGYFLGDFVDSVAFETKEVNYWEMVTHHVLTLTLLLGMTFQNGQRGGAIVQFVHSASDVLLSLGKALSNSQYDTATGVVFVSAVLVWIYLRNIVLPLLISVAV